MADTIPCTCNRLCFNFRVPSVYLAHYWFKKRTPLQNNSTFIVGPPAFASSQQASGGHQYTYTHDRESLAMLTTCCLLNIIVESRVDPWARYYDHCCTRAQRARCTKRLYSQPVQTRDLASLVRQTHRPPSPLDHTTTAITHFPAILQLREVCLFLASVAVQAVVFSFGAHRLARQRRNMSIFNISGSGYGDI